MFLDLKHIKPLSKKAQEIHEALTFLETGKAHCAWCGSLAVIAEWRMHSGKNTPYCADCNAALELDE